MKLQIVSDLHLEFNPGFDVDNQGADVLCLAGDICLAHHLYRNPISKLPNNDDRNFNAKSYRDFFDHVSKQFDRVLYVMGNHEHYSGYWNNTAEWLKEALEPWPNITLLDNQWVDFDRVRIAGTSLWTDLNKRDPLTVMSVKDMMNDYFAITIKNGEKYHKLRPQDTLLAHEHALQFIKVAYETTDKNVVVLGHHAPSRQSVHSRYHNQEIMNGAFCNDLDQFILDSERIKLWIHGHVHDHWDYMIGGCRVVCNPRGYPRERTNYQNNFIVEV